MSKIVYTVFRNKTPEKGFIERIKGICDNLNPDNIIAKPTKIISGEGIILGMSNPSETILTEGINVLFGHSFGNPKKWFIPEGFIPDGNFAIFRTDDKKLEIVTDILGTKAIWYYKDEELFIASSSQRAIIQFLGKYDFNEEVIPWMVCNGLLGPGQSWDKNISLLMPDTSLNLDRENWQITSNPKEVNFKPNNCTDKENIEKFNKTLTTVFSEISLDYSKWKLTLSGGHDSRGILFALPKQDENGQQIETITWGLKNALEIKGNDAQVAKKMAQKFNLAHHYFPTDTSSEDSLEVILKRFFNNGEGRIDHLGGYTDGFKIWKTLFESDVKGIIRGDEVFGSYEFISEFHMKKFIGLTVPDDYNNLKEINLFGDNPSSIPKKFEIKKDETFEMWRDRLYHSYLVPYFLSALEDLKQPYIEQINPLLSRRIVNLVRELPDHLRTEKKIFKLFVNSYDENIEYAKFPAIKIQKNIFREIEMVDKVKTELNSPLAKTIFSQDFLSIVLSNLQTHSNQKNIKSKWILKLKGLIPKEIKKRVLKETFSPNIDMNMVGFRLFMICRMIRILEEDSFAIPEIGKNSEQNQPKL